MASIGVAGAAGMAAAKGSAFAWNPFVFAGAMALASYLDQQFLYPAILGDGKQQAKPRPLIGLPTTTTTPGTPRVWAMGRRVRVPTHIMFQSEKTREDTVGGPKGGVAGVIKRVFADVGLCINDRETARLTQLIANGQLIYWSDKNLVRITTDQMTSSMSTTTVTTGTVAAAGTTTTVVTSVAGGMVVDTYARNYRWLQITSGPLSGQARPIISNTATQFTVDWAFGAIPGAGVTYSVIEKRLVLTMNSNYEPDFADYLVVGDIVDLQGFNATPDATHFGRSPWEQKSWWRVNAITAHAATPSSITLEAMIGQDMGPMTGVMAGSSFSPASVVREDTDLVLATSFNTLGASQRPGAVGVYTGMFDIGGSTTSLQQQAEAYVARFLGTTTRISTQTRGMQYLAAGVWQTLTAGAGNSAHYADTRFSTNVTTTTFANRAVDWRPRCANNTATISRDVLAQYEGRMFVSNPADWFYGGSDTQTENGILLKSKTSGEVPGFRGMAYQMLEQWDLSTYFGNQVPPIIEAIIESDASMSVPQGILEVCERAQSPDLKFDTADVNLAPMEGYWTQGALPTVLALQPLLTAYQIAAQERNDTLAFFNIENADIVQIENGASFSDLGVQSGADTPFAGDKLKITQRDIADLPTSIGVTHQDPDQQYAQGYQHFKQRQPSPLPSANEQSVNLDNVVLSRKQARNLAGTIMRRAWVNSTALEFQLPVAYIELLENDLVTLTSDDGQDFTARIIRREIGNNFVVNVYAVVEDVALAVRGSPVQGPGTIRISTPELSQPTARILDIPPLDDGDAFVPGYYVGGSSPDWQGAIVYESRDGGSNYTQVAVLNAQCGMGTTTTSLASGTPGDGIGFVIWDAAGTFTVAIDNVGPLGFLVTQTEAEVEAGLNWMLVDDGTTWEILGARDVLDNGDGTYTFSYLLRGLRGTYDSAATTKALGSKVTFLSYARQLGGLQFVPINLSASSLPVTLQIKVVASGQALIDVTAETVTVYGWNARPMPGRMFSTELDLTTYDRAFTFENSTRLNQPVGSGGPFNLDESFEGYSVRIYDPTGTTLQRTKTITSQTTGTSRIRGDRSVPYPAAEQTADGYTPGPSETFKVERAQLGDFGEGRSWMEDV